MAETPLLDCGLGGLFFEGERPERGVLNSWVGGGMMGLEELFNIEDGGGGDEFSCLEGWSSLLYAAGWVIEDRCGGDNRPLGVAVVLRQARGVTSRLP